MDKDDKIPVDKDGKFVEKNGTKGAWPVPVSVKEGLSYWDSGMPVMSVTMGGIGPGYEQCIQIAMIEILRAALKGVPVVQMEEELGRIDKRLGLQLTGGQAGAAMALAGEIMTYGWSATVEKYKNRQIMVSKAWPSSEAGQKMEEIKKPISIVGFGKRKL